MNNRATSLLQPGIFRLFLAILVLVNHSSRFDLGDWAVYTFFILSGYWIYRMWEEKYSKARAPYRLFICSRILRILPVFLLANLLSALVLAATHPVFPGPQWRWLYAAGSNLFLLGYANLPFSQGGLRVAWSLDVEMQFYLVFPFAFYLCTQARPLVLWKVLIGAGCIVGITVFFIPNDIGARNLTCYALYFLIGAAAARRNWRPSGKLADALLISMFCLVAFCWCSPDARQLFENAKHGATESGIHSKRVLQALLAIVTAPIALLSVRNHSSRFDRTLGEFTYVFYLMHWPVMMLHAYYFENLPPLQRLPSLLGAWTVVTVASLLIFQYFDQPIERTRKRWVANQVAAQS